MSHCLQTGSAVFSATAESISTKVGVWLDTPYKSLNLKHQDDPGMERRVTGLNFSYRGLVAKRLGLMCVVPSQGAKRVSARGAVLRRSP